MQLEKKVLGNSSQAKLTNTAFEAERERKSTAHPEKKGEYHLTKIKSYQT